MTTFKPRPPIGINLDFEIEPFPRSVLRDGYYDSVYLAGGAPLLLPPIDDPDLIETMLDHVSGLVFTGGADLDPRDWGEEPHPSLTLLPRRRQDFDLALARAALARRIPILAICCGMQTVNVARGGSLIQDIASFVTDPVKHSTGVRGLAAEHEVAIRGGTHLGALLETESIVVNSAHHQSCGRLGPGLKVAATAADGVVEAFEDPDYPFLLGVQWHPERLSERRQQLALFVALVGAARAWGEGSRPWLDSPEPAGRIDPPRQRLPGGA